MKQRPIHPTTWSSEVATLPAQVGEGTLADPIPTKHECPGGIGQRHSTRATEVGVIWHRVYCDLGVI